MFRKFTGLVALTLVAAAAPAHACWDAATMRAAQIRHLDVMMMVSALRCRKGADDFLPSYNRFVVRNRPQLQAANRVLTAHFARSGARQSDLALDAFVIGIANSYGGGHPVMDCHALKGLADRLADGVPDEELLLAHAYREAGTMEQVGRECRVRIAAR